VPGVPPNIHAPRGLRPEFVFLSAESITFFLLKLKLHNRNSAKVISSALDARDWNETKLAQQAGVTRTTISHHLRGARRIRSNHLKQYLALLNHQERCELVVAWLRDNLAPELLQDVLNKAGDDLSPAAKEFVPALKDEDRRALAWLSRQIARDGELSEWLRQRLPWIGYHPRRIAAKRRCRRGGAVLIACLAFTFMLTPAPGPHSCQLRRSALNFRGRESLSYSVTEAA